MKKLFLFAAAATITLATFTGCDKDEPPRPAAGAEVVIGGITWATCNVGEAGKFVTKPEDHGKLYDFDEAQTACPEGWRVPTAEELESLVASGSEWETRGETDGVRFGGGANTLFLPTAGFRSGPVGEEILYAERGRYWSSTAQSTLYASSLAFNLRPAGAGVDGFFISVSKDAFFQFKSVEMSVRCVKK
jgi:uncharacterized protein (TIGR02145 family)